MIINDSFLHVVGRCGERRGDRGGEGRAPSHLGMLLLLLVVVLLRVTELDAARRGGVSLPAAVAAPPRCPAGLLTGL